MKQLTFLILAITGTSVFAQETTLFDSDGNAVAYISTDSRNTIYLWNGTPVAYIHAQNNNFHIYGFNGQHLGWFANGFIRDNNGHIVGAIKDVHPRVTRVEPVKSVKHVTPVASVRVVPPVKSVFSTNWSRTPLNVLLSAGR